MADKYASKASTSQRQRVQEFHELRRKQGYYQKGYRNRNRECMNSFGKLKKGFPTQAKALASKGAREGHLRAYECSLCHQWHLTKVEKTHSQARKYVA